MNHTVTKYFKLKALDRFILGELTGPFFFGMMSFTIILVAGGLLFKIADLVIQRGVAIGIVVRLFLYYLPRLIAYTIPMSCLLAALLGFSKLSSNSEIVALKSAGLSFQRIVKPVVIAAFFISISSFLVNETLVPLSERAAANVMVYEVLKKSPPVFKEKVFLKEESGDSLKRVIYINNMELRTGKMKEIVVEEFEKGRLSRVISSEKGKWVNGSWWLENGKVFDIDGSGTVNLLFKFNKQALTLDLNPQEAVRSSRSPEEMTIPEIYREIKLRGKTGLDTSELIMILNTRISLPWACIVLAIVGAALGARPQRSSSSVGFGLSVIIVFVYYVILSFTQSLGVAGYIPPFVAAWLANIFFLIIGARLCIRANKLG